MATNLESQIQNYNNKNLDDNSKVYDTKDLLNQLTNLIPNLYKGTLTVSSQRVNLNTDWNTLKVNQIYRVEDISGVNSPDKNKLDNNTAGTLFVYGDENLGTNFKVFISGSMIVYKQQSDSQYYYLGKGYVTNTDLDTAIKTLQDKFIPLLDAKADEDSVVHLDSEIGGRNYLLNTGNPSKSNPIHFPGTTYLALGSDTYSGSKTTLTTATSGETYYMFNQPANFLPIPAGKTYNISYDLSGKDGLYAVIMVSFLRADKDNPAVSNWTNSILNFHKTQQTPQRITDVFQITDDVVAAAVALYVFQDENKTLDNSGTKSISFDKVMLERSSVQHDWVPAPEDIVASDKAIQLVNGVDIDTVVKSGTYSYTSNNPSGAKHGPDGHDSWFLLEVNDLMGDSVNGVQKYYDTNDGTGFVRTWSQNGSNRVFTPWAPSVEVGKEMDGADLNDSLQVGTFFSATKVTNGPGFYNQGYGDVMITWTVTKVSNGTTQVYNQNAYNRNGECATRNFVSGAGWGSWKILSTDPSKPMDFPGGITSGGVDVATAADLKSVADKAWYQLDNKYITTTTAKVLPVSTVLYRVDDANKRLYLQGSILLNSNTVEGVNVDFSSVVKTILSSQALSLGYANGWQNWTDLKVQLITPAAIRIPASFNGLAVIGVNTTPSYSATDIAYVTYDELV